MDPRPIQTNAIRPVAEELYGRPHMWRFWRVLPPKARVAIFVGSCYSQPLLQRVYKESGRADLELQIEEILGFEQTPSAENSATGPGAAVLLADRAVDPRGLVAIARAVPEIVDDLGDRRRGRGAILTDSLRGPRSLTSTRINSRSPEQTPSRPLR